MTAAQTGHARETLTRRRLMQMGVALAASSGSAAFAQAGGVTKLVVPYTPGASNDIIARLFAERMARRTGGAWIVENKPGAGSMLGAEFVAKAPADGTTLLLCSAANMGVLPAIRKSVRFNVNQDFTFLTRIASSPFSLAIHSSLPATSFAEFIKYAKSKPGAIRIGTSGIGALDYMGASLLQSEFGLDLQIIPYKGMSGVLNDLRAGHIEASMVSPATISPMAKEGHVRVLAVMDNQRSEVLPAVPSAKELGHPKLKVINWWGIAGPAKLPPATADALRRNMAAVLADPAFAKAVKDKGFEPAPLAGDEFARFIGTELISWKAIAAQAKISIDE